MTDTPHDDTYRRLREKIARWADRNEIKPEYRDYLLAVPDLFHLLTCLVLDKRVSGRDKAWLGVAVAYVISPIDLIPDFLGPIGYVDDLIVMVMVLDSVLSRVPASIVKEYWAGEGDVLQLIRESLAKADSWVGKGLYRKVVKFLEEQGVLKPRPSSAGASATPKAATATTKKRTKKTAAQPKASKSPAASAQPKAPAKKKTARKKATRTVGPRRGPAPS